MASLKVLLLVGIVLVSVSSIRLENQFLTFNTSSNRYVVSTSIATNFDKQFVVYSPFLVGAKQSTAKFTPQQSNGKLLTEPKFVSDDHLLYNDFNDGQYWFGFKRPVGKDQADSTSTFAFAKITYDGTIYDFIYPLFSLPLSFLNMNRLYRCDNVLISYQKTNKLIDIAVFSERESWHLFPEATWGFRNKQDGINFSRQTYPLGTTIEIDVGKEHFCVLSEDLALNNYQVVEKQVYTVQDLLTNYSTELELKPKIQNEQL